jgi:chromosome segregation protein
LLKLKEIEMLGFKSFADKTRLICDGSTVAVVGPNGCGKSNLADAVSWALGEQSARVLRGERMADVIFNGTGMRPPTGLAEVSMTLVQANEVKTGAADGAPNGGDAASRFRDGEIKVTRRLFRSGESEYLLNGNLCRLRDIQDIFMGTGLGPESYAIIEQGRIGQILSSKPSDRRSIIEEAAGVSKFKSRKRLAEAKLESARQNLARINDILEEISKQVNSLKRQASKAGRYRELQQQLRNQQKRVYTSRWVSLENDFQNLQQDLTATQGLFSAATEELETLENEKSHLFAHHERIEEELTQLRNTIAQTELEAERLRSRLEKSRQQADDLNERTAEAKTEKELLHGQAAAIDRQAEEQARRTEELHNEWTSAEQDASKLKADHERGLQRLGGIEREAEAQRQAVLEAVSRAANLRNQVVQAEEMGLSAERQLARARSEHDVAAAEHRQIITELDSIVVGHKRQEDALNVLAQSLSEAQSRLQQARQEEASLRQHAEGLNRELSRVSARKQALEESLARHAYATDSVRRLISMASQENGFRPLGVMADFLEVANGYEEVVEEFLKDELDCVVVEKHDDARNGIALLKNDGGGRSAFFVRHMARNGDGAKVGASTAFEAACQPGVLTSLQELVKLEPRLGLNGDPPFPVLAHAFVVEDAVTAERMAAAYPSCHFLTPQGEHYHHRLVSGGKASSAGPLALRRDFRELERQAGELQNASSEAQRQWAEAQARVETLEHELRRLTEERLDAEKQTLVSSEKLRQAQEAVQRAADRLRVIEREFELLESEKKRIEEQRTTLGVELERARDDQELHEKAMAEATAALRSLRSELDELNRGLTEAQVKASALQERWRAAEAEHARLITEAAQGREKLTRLASQVEAWSAEASRLKREADEAEASRTEAESGLQALRDRLGVLEEECRQARYRRDELSPKVEAARARVDAVREKRLEIEVALARAESDLRHLGQQCHEDLGVEPASLRAEVAAEDLFDGERLQAAETELHDLKARLERLGPVNMMALEELQEAEQRLTFLETQRQDLLASITDTTQTIREIDEASQRKFMDAFSAINSFFGESFRALFGGGMGEMRFSDEADSESGIELVVQPPGKRLQNVLLLSGGEKALTALALLIAVFRFAPSPFCILDEVDAPLDDTNVIRFARMIGTMSCQTQFIIITHNKRTMEACGMMYGVTMEEAGVSKLVSVRFEENRLRPEARAEKAPTEQQPAISHEESQREIAAVAH